MEKEFCKCQNIKNGHIKMVLKETTQTAWFKNSDWVVLKTEGLKKQEPKVEEPIETTKVEEVTLDETNTTEVVDSEEEIERLKTEIKSITGKRPKTKNIEKLNTQLNDLHNNGI